MANIMVLTKLRATTAVAAVGVALLLSTTGMALAADNYIDCSPGNYPYCYGSSSTNDVMRGAEIGQSMYGFGGLDRVGGNGGNDAIDGGADGDTLVGGYGNDTLVGGPGVDHLYGNEGDDRIYAKDGAKDGTIDCGPGYDRVESDPSDVVGASCEVALRDHRS